MKQFPVHDLPKARIVKVESLQLYQKILPHQLYRNFDNQTIMILQVNTNEKTPCSDWIVEYLNLTTGATVSCQYDYFAGQECMNFGIS